MWFPETEPWQYRVLDMLPRGVDEAQLRANLEMTPTERIRAVMKAMEVAEAMRRARAKAGASAGDE